MYTLSGASAAPAETIQTEDEFRYIFFSIKQ